ncbi:MAG: OsmC family protein [Bacteroidia bacterium]|nr:OsmC family protein [Bacteroidia bacterium]
MNSDKSKTLMASIRLLNEKLHFEGNVEGNTPISIDYTPPLGDNLGYTSLELFLLSFSSCAGSAILVLLRKMNKIIDKFDITSVGQRKESHPTGFSSIAMQVNIKSKNLNADEMEKVIGMIDSICPVLSMLDKNINTTINFEIHE